MSTITTSPLLPAIVPPVPIHRFTVDQYHQMIQTGVLKEDDDVELLEGSVYTDPTGPDAAPRYRTQQNYRAGDVVPFVVDGSDLGPIPAQELIP